MSVQEYLDFEVEIGLGIGREYPVSVIRSPGGEARGHPLFPFDELALESRLKDLHIALLRSGGTRRLALTQQERNVQDFGQALFDFLVTGEIRSRYDVSQREAARQSKGLRIKLRIQPPELLSLPWEFLYDPRASEYVCLSTQTPLVRYIELPQVIPPLGITPPLRILGVTASPRGLVGLDVDNEKLRVEVALRELVKRKQVKITWQEHMTWRGLQRTMRGGPWHILHFIGHGGFDRATDEGFIALEDENGELARLPATQLARLLADHTTLRLSVLNSCEGAQGSNIDIFSSTASLLVRRGLPAVLAMQYEITDRAAIEFARGFYEALADGLPVDAATAGARISISLGVANTIEWGTPVLFMRAPDGMLFRPETPGERAAHREAERHQREQARREAEATKARLMAEREAREKAAREWAERDAAENAAYKVEGERVDREKAEAEQKAGEESERLLAKQKAYEERTAKEATEHLAAVRAEKERFVQEKAQAERKTKEEAKQLSTLKAEEARLARERTKSQGEVAKKIIAKESKLSKSALLTIGIVGVVITTLVVYGYLKIKFLPSIFGGTATQVPFATESPSATPPQAEATKGPESSAASGVVKVLLIGKPDEDSIDPVNGANIPGVKHLEEMFEAAHPSIDMEVINIPWGSGATGYGPRTESMIQAQEACVYLMPSAFQYGRRGYLENLDPWIANDPTFKDAWPGDYLEQWHDIGPGNPDNQWALPYSGGNRVIHYDAKLFNDWGVEPLSQHPTLAEIETKAKAMTGINPVTGEQNYGYWYQGKYINWQFQAIAHALGATWGKVNDDGTWTIDWDTPEYLQALEWLVMMSKYAPPGALAADAMPEGFLTDQNVVAIIPEGETGYYLTPFVNDPKLNERFRTIYNLQGSDGKGGLFIADPVAMAVSCPNKAAAWEVMKWLTMSPESQKYNFDAGGNLPVIEGAAEAIPAIGALIDADAILNQNAFAERRYPWASSQPRFSLQAAIESALAGTLSPKQALEQAQQETEDWLAQQATPTP